MRPNVVMVVICSLFLAAGLSAALLPVTGDTSAVWTAIDLSPTDSTMKMVSLTPEETTSRENDTDRASTETPEYQPSPWDETPAPATKKPAATTPKQPSASVKTIRKKVSIPDTTETPVATNEEIDATASDDTSATTDSAQEIIPGSIIVTSVPESAQIIINDVNVGKTPYNVQGFYPGFYDIVIKADGYASLKKSIELKAGGTEFITAQLIREAGHLYVLSTPENATVSINDTVVGMTPFTSSPLSPGIYRLAIELTGYSPYSEQLGISPNLTDTLQIALLPEKKTGLFTGIDFGNSKSIRRISFGAVGIFATAAGLYLNAKAAKSIDREQRALDQYHEARLSETEYTERYHTYQDESKSTDRYALLRNICYGLGIAGGVGFTVSLIY